MKNLLMLLANCLFVSMLFGQGVISGTIIDENNGEPLIGANVVIAGTATGTSTDIDGKYQFDAAAGTYSLLVSYIGYQEKTITEVVVKEKEITYLDVALSDEAVDLGVEVVVQAKMIERSENAVLLLRKNAEVVQDGISAQEMTRYAVSDAAGALKKVTGATVEGGKYVFIRGLGDRYSLSQLNGLTLPSTDPYRNSAQLDLIPTNLLDNIITTKSFTPDQPGTFTGGNVDVRTKSFPEAFSFTVSLSTQFNQQSNLRDDFLTHRGGNTDYLGYDDGFRAIPTALTDPASRQLLNATGYNEAIRRGNDEAARAIDAAAKGVIPQFSPTTTNSPLDHGIALSFGNKYSLFGQDLGVIAAASFKQSYQQLNDFQEGNWEVFSVNSDQLFRRGDFRTDQSTQSPTVNGLLGLAYRLGSFSNLNFNFIYNHTADKVSRQVFGERPDNIETPNFLEARQLSFTERSLINYQLGGEHVLPGWNEAKIEWRASVANSRQYEPQTRFFENILNTENGRYTVGAAQATEPFYFWRDLEDEQVSGKLDFTLPLGKGKSNRIKVGSLLNRKDRVATEDRFRLRFRLPSGTFDDANGDTEAFVARDNVGVLGTDERGRYIVGNSVEDNTLANNSYTGHEYVYAGYGMLSYNLLPNLKFVGGARIETTDILSVGGDTNAPDSVRIGSIQETDVLPSANLIFEVVKDMNVRATYSRTLARPNLREISPFFSIDPIINAFFFGNTDLQKTNISNYDLRWEWFFAPGQLVAVSGYYKEFENPIVLQLNRSANREFVFTNAPNGNLYGLELELRKDLAFLGNLFRNLRFNTNVSLITSNTEVIRLTEFDPENRPFIGQPSTIINTALNYVDADGGWDATLALNYVGDRLNAVGREGTPDLYDRGRTQLDFNLIKKLGDINLRFSVQNMLDDPFVQSVDYRGSEFIFSDFQRGVDWGLGISYTFR